MAASMAACLLAGFPSALPPGDALLPSRTAAALLYEPNSSVALGQGHSHRRHAHQQEKAQQQQQQQQQQAEPSLVALVLTLGCTGSTAMMISLQAILESHGMSIFSVSGLKQELFKCEKNPRCKGGDVTGALKPWVDEARAQGKVLLAKGGPSMDSTAQQMKLMRRMGARAFVLRRENRLAQLVCNVRTAHRCTPLGHR